MDIRRIKLKLKVLLMELKPGESIYRRTLWCLLSDKLGNIDADGDDRMLRKIVKELDLPIGSSPSRGYFRIYSQCDFNQAVGSMVSKVAGMNKSIKMIKRNAERYLGTQLTLPGVDV